MKFNSLIPELSVTDIAASRKFYVDELGFKIEYERPKEHFIFLSLGSAQLMIEQCNGHWETGALARPFGRGINFQIEVADPTKLYEHLKAREHSFFRELTSNCYETASSADEQIEFLIQDPDGYLLRFCN